VLPAALHLVLPRACAAAAPFSQPAAPWHLLAAATAETTSLGDQLAQPAAAKWGVKAEAHAGRQGKKHASVSPASRHNRVHEKHVHRTMCNRDFKVYMRVCALLGLRLKVCW
jgi:hypothetical protein